MNHYDYVPCDFSWYLSSSGSIIKTEVTTKDSTLQSESNVVMKFR